MTAEDLSTILCVESSLSVIDAYQAQISTLCEIMRRSDLEYVQCLLGDSVDPGELGELGDWRLAMLNALVKKDFRPIPLRDLEADEAFLRGDYYSAGTSALARIREVPTDIDSIALAAMSYAILGNAPDLAA
jgi:hypothetical protein